MFHNHLIVGAEGGRATCLAGIDRVTRRYIDVVGRAVGVKPRLIRRILAGGDDGGIRDPRDTIDNFSCRGRLREHQEQVLTGGRTGQTEFQVLSGSDENFVQQIDRIVGVASVRMLERFVLHGPDLAARDRRSGLFNIGSEHDRAGGAPGSAQNDVVVRIRIEKDIGAIEGIQSAVHAIERCASAADEADIGNASSGRSGNAERITARVARGPRIATQGSFRYGTCPKCGQTGREGRGQGCHQNVVVIVSDCAVL
ncbi:hypothetical protein D3C85_524890 [compost metagenome]